MRYTSFHRFDLLEPADVALAAVELRGQEGADELGGERRADDLGPEAEDVHVVVLDPLMRRIGVVADRRADPRELARGDRRANARAADEDAALGLAAENRLADLPRLVRVVDPDRVGVHAAVEDVVPELRERREHRVAQVEAAVVERGDDVHVTRSSSAVAFATTLSTLKPSRSSTVVPGADAPKRSSETLSPRSPTQRFHPSETPASTESRAWTSGGRTSSR